MQELDTAYRYDSINRLVEERRVTDGDRYSYDPAGNRLKKQHYIYSRENTIDMAADAAGRGIIDGEEAYCYNERNELTEKKTLSAVTRYLYNENGSLVNEKEGSKSTSYQYDLLNRQIYVKTLDGREQENCYDGEGLRAGIKENGRISTFLYYNGEILAECSDKNKPVRRHLRGIGLSSVQTLNDNKYYAYHQDEQGSTAYITGKSGAAENCYAYDAFGNVLESRETIENRIQYTGQQYDQETGQYYLRARFYNPAVGRFMQEDTYRGNGLNLYAYCGNNPLRYYDPSGHEMEDYSDDSVVESGHSRVEQVDGEFVNAGNGGLGFESGTSSKIQEVFDIADNYNLSDDTFNNHILDRHGPNSAYGNKSHFNSEFDIKGGIDSTLKGDNFVVGPNTAGRDGYIFEQTFSNPIGTSSNGKPLYTLKVVIDEAGNVITTFPKK